MERDIILARHTSQCSEVTLRESAVQVDGLIITLVLLSPPSSIPTTVKSI